MARRPIWLDYILAVLLSVAVGVWMDYDLKKDLDFIVSEVEVGEQTADTAFQQIVVYQQASLRVQAHQARNDARRDGFLFGCFLMLAIASQQFRNAIKVADEHLSVSKVGAQATVDQESHLRLLTDRLRGVKKPRPQGP